MKKLVSVQIWKMIEVEVPEGQSFSAEPDWVQIAEWAAQYSDFSFGEWESRDDLRQPKKVLWKIVEAPKPKSIVMIPPKKLS